ncbi:MAG TPA: hypothetical protein VMD75_13960, partial [Candidatus Binataceae bacterium]|nr:hypothetical protein [Candidatus Binataceae bacterium]
EGLAFHETAYLGDWSALTKFRVQGRDALDFLSLHCVNDLSRFGAGQIKHAIQTNDSGKIVGEGVLYKISDLEYRYSGGGAYWLNHCFQQGKWQGAAVVDSADEFVFAVQGPKSLYVMEKATGESLRDLKFSHTRMTKVGNHAVRILRTGVTGELGYEFHGPSEIGNEIWLAVQKAGDEFGLKLLGGRSQLVSHVEGCFPTIGRDFWPSVSALGGSRAHLIQSTGGSYEWSTPAELMRSPFELGWAREVSLDTHDFIGREALLAEKSAGGPARRLVGLKWNSEDVLDVFAGLFRTGPTVIPMELPRNNQKHAINPDKVLKNGKVVGCSTSRVYSAYLRQMISLCVIDQDLTEPETPVSVVWGDRDKPQKEIRAIVCQVPFKEDRRRTDVTKL